MKDKIFSGILGLICGDMIGVPVEFKSRIYLKRNPVEDILSYGTHNQPAGTWSDDSSLTLCLIDSLCNGYDLEDISKKFIGWFDAKLWTPHGMVFDIGNATRKAMTKLKYGSNPTDAGGKTEGDNGNGSLMRILPLAYVLKDKSEKEKYSMIRDVSSLTHGHDISILSCVIYIEMAINLLNGLSINDSYNKTIEYINDNYKDNKEIEKFNRILNGKLSALKEKEISSSGYVISTLEASLWCLLNRNNYESTVLTAVNLGDDTDTVGAVSGGLAGIYYGYSSIPKDWIDILARKDDILNLCEKFSNKIYN